MAASKRRHQRGDIGSNIKQQQRRSAARQRNVTAAAP